MRIYVGWVEGGWGDSGFINNASISKEKLIESLKNDICRQETEIRIYDSETGELIEDCDCMFSFADGSKCKCSECKQQKIEGVI